jgi:hypothetical protein
MVDDVIDWLLEFELLNLPWWIDASILAFLLLGLPLLWSRFNNETGPRYSSIPESDLVGGLPDRPTDAERDVARAVANRLLSPSFIHRRVERITFRESRTVQRQVSVDIDLRDGCRLIPVGLSRKDPSDSLQIGVRKFSVVCDPLGSLSLLGRRENSAWTFHALCVWFEQRIVEVLRDLSSDATYTTVLTDEERTRLWRVVSGSYEKAAPAVGEIFALHRESEQLVGAPRTDDWLQRVNELGPLGRLALALYIDQALGILISRLAASWVLLVEYQHDHSRKVIKVSFNDPIDPKAFDNADVGRLTRLFVGLGWLRGAIQIPSVTSLPAQSVHLEFEPPEGLEIETAVLAARTTASARRADSRLDAKEAALLFKALTVGDSIPPELGIEKAASDSEGRWHVSSHAYLPKVKATQSLDAYIWMRAARTPKLVSGALGTLLLAGLLWLGSARPAAFAAGPDTLLLTVPAVLMGFLLLQQHELVSQVTWALRPVLWFAVMISAVAIGLAVSTDHLSSEALRNGFRILRWPATLLASLMIPIFVRRTSKTVQDSE